MTPPLPALPSPRRQTPDRRNEGPIRVLLVDDSAVVRGLLSRLITEQPDLEVAATAANGRMAVNAVAERSVDVVVLDIEMPVMDGLTALPRLLAVDPHLRIIIASTLSTPGAAVTMRALAAGAADYVAKPSATREITEAGSANGDFRRDLVIKIRSLGEAGRRQRRGVTSTSTRLPVASTLNPVPAFALRPLRPLRPEVIVVGSSTGGPQALSRLIGGLGRDLAQPILVVQHMPPTFTAILAEHLARACNRPCAEGRDGEDIQPGRIYVAPGDHHMTVGADGRRRLIRINRDAPENFCRPAVDVLFRGAARAYGAATLAVVLAGIGADGTRGGRENCRGGGDASRPGRGDERRLGHAGLGRPRRLVQRHPAAVRPGPADQPHRRRRPLMSPEDFTAISELLKRRSGLILPPEKAYLLESRLRPVMQKHALTDLSAVAAALTRQDAKLTADVIDAMTTNETLFFHDVRPFTVFREAVLPALLVSRAAQRSFRILCAAASTGQEPYSLAMILAEEAARLKGWTSEIIASSTSRRRLWSAPAPASTPSSRCNAACLRRNSSGTSTA